MSVGINIRKLRELRNFTQTHLSDRLNMSLSGYNKIERDVTNISLLRLEQIARVLETDIETILHFDKKIAAKIPTKVYQDTTPIGKNGNGSLIAQLKSENQFLRELLKSKFL